MAQEILAGPLGELRAASTADGGTALTTTAGFIYLPLYSNHIFITPRNFSAAVVAKFLLNPWLVVLKTTDGMATATNLTDYSENAQDGSASTDVTLSSLDTLANGDFLLVGAPIQYRGVYVDVDSTNSTAAVLTVSYWNGVWTDTGDTDGTITSSTTFAKDGLVYWAVPASWRAETLKNIYPNCPDKTISANGDYVVNDLRLYWTRWEVDTAIDSSVTLDAMWAANRSTAYAELLSGQCFEEKIKHGIGGIGCVEALTNAGTANLIVNAASLRDGRFQ